MGPQDPATQIVTQVVSARGELQSLVRALATAERIAVDVESDGMFAYRAQVCTVQLCAGGEVSVVDALAAPLDPLATLLGAGGPLKIVHDVSFDARILAQQGIALGNVRDTSIAAQFLERPATGLAALALKELGAVIDKGLQKYDWRIRPLLAEHVTYLARDVAHLEALAEALWREVDAKGIGAEVDEETRYRIATALASTSAVQDLPAYAEAKGFDRIPERDRAVFRRLWEAREKEGLARDVPSTRLVPTDALIALARSRPATSEALEKTRWIRDRSLARPILAAIEQGTADGDIPADDKARIDRPRPPREVIARRKAREIALTTWRRAEAKRRGVGEQVVLPGHCLKGLAAAEGSDAEVVQSTPGFGTCRAPYAAQLAAVLVAAASAPISPESAVGDGSDAG